MPAPLQPRKVTWILLSILFSLSLVAITLPAPWRSFTGSLGRAAQLSYPPCPAAIQTEIQAKLKEKLPEAQALTECFTVENGYFFRFESLPVMSSAGNSYRRYASGEANEDRTALTLTVRIPQEKLAALINRIELQPIYTETIGAIANPFRYVNTVGGIIVGIESGRAGAGKPNLFFAAASPATIKPIRETQAGTDTSLPAIPIADLGITFDRLTLQNFSTSVLPPPPVPPLPQPQPPTNPPPSIQRIRNPAFALCDPSALKAVAYAERSDAVHNLQRCLIGLGYSIPAGATGYYGNQTVAALKKFYKEQANYSWHGLKFGPLGIETLQRIAATAR